MRGDAGWGCESCKREYREASAFGFLRDGKPGKCGLNARPCFRYALLQVRAPRNRVAETGLEGAIFFRQAAGDFNQARYTFAQHLDIFVHVAGW